MQELNSWSLVTDVESIFQMHEIYKKNEILSQKQEELSLVWNQKELYVKLELQEVLSHAMETRISPNF